MSKPEEAITYTKIGQMRPALPRRIHNALHALRAHDEPYFDKEKADRAEHALRVEIAAELRDWKRRLDNVGAPARPRPGIVR